MQDTKTKLDDKKQCFYIPVKFLVTHEYNQSAEGAGGLGITRDNKPGESE